MASTGDKEHYLSDAESNADSDNCVEELCTSSEHQVSHEQSENMVISSNKKLAKTGGYVT